MPTPGFTPHPRSPRRTTAARAVAAVAVAAVLVAGVVPAAQATADADATATATANTSPNASPDIAARATAEGAATATPALSPPANPFRDIPANAFYRNAVGWLVAWGITTGLGSDPTLFGPSGTVNRAQMAAFLWRMMGQPASTVPCGFNDVPTGAFFEQGACWLKATGITTGAGGNPTRFDPNGVVSRAQMAAFLWRLAGQPRIPAATLATPPAPCGFADVGSDAFFATAACWLKLKGITTGVGGDASRFGGDGAVTRAQMAAFLDRFASSPEAFNDAPPPSAKINCEVLDPRSCLLPFPSNHFTTSDPTTDTGLRVAIDRTAMPANKLSVRVDPTEHNRSDGFSPGSGLMVHLPGVDLTRSGTAPITDIASSLNPGGPVVILNTTTGEPHPHWVETDSQTPNDADRVTFIRPAVNFDEGTRYVVALRGLVNAAGVPLTPSSAFTALRDSVASTPAVEARRDGMEAVFDELAGYGIDRSGLYLAWDFTVASERNLSERLLHMRDTAFGALGNAAPAVTITRTEVAGGNPATIRRVWGSITVPNFLTGDGSAGQKFALGADGLPRRNTTRPNLQVPFWCVVPLQATPDNPSAMALSGHGLLGSGEDLVTTTSFDWVATGGNLTVCGADLWGLARSDLIPVGVILNDLSGFASLVDRGQQSLLNFLFLGRAMKMGLTSNVTLSCVAPPCNPALPDPNKVPVTTNPFARDGQNRTFLDLDQLYYNGNSMGGIMGGALMAVAQDFTRGLLGVPGMNYSLLLDRSILGDIFQVVLRQAYPDPIERPIAMAINQMLWDRSEANGYAHHVTSDPYANTPAKDLLIFMAFADEAVANVSTEVMVRTMNIPIRQPALARGRSTDVTPFWGIDAIGSFPHRGSGMLVWDFGNPPPPTTNTGPPETPGFPAPHAAGSRLSALRTLVFDYLSSDGVFNDVCNGAPCAGPRDL